MTLRAPFWLACVVIAACGPIVDPEDGSGAGTSVGEPSTVSADGTSAVSADGTSTVSASDSASDSATDSATNSVGEASADSSDECTDICIADFPCFGYEPNCVDASTVEVYMDVPCEEVCSGYCDCRGSSCMLDGEAPCPEGTWCVDTNQGASCQAAEGLCGGPDGLECAADELCEYVTDLCPECVDDPGGCGPGSPVGVCVPRPAPDEECPELDPDGDPFEPQCGCDGVYYPNECERLKAGVPWAGDPLTEPGVCR